MSKRSSEPLADYWVGQFAGRLLVWLGKRAFDRGDFHEYDHVRAALVAGNSEHREGESCRLMWP